MSDEFTKEAIAGLRDLSHGTMTDEVYRMLDAIERRDARIAELQATLVNERTGKVNRMFTAAQLAADDALEKAANGRRLIVCGCRDWTDEAAVRGAIMLDYAGRREGYVVVHGACPTGADMLAEKFCREVNMRTEPHPADWAKHGKGAGVVRNGKMVALGADQVLAFWDGKSPGTLDTIKRASATGIPVRIVPKPLPRS